jgi:EpsI family protein
MIALLSNGLRVAIIGFLSYFKLSTAIHGPGHMLQGLFVSGIGLMALLASVSLLAKRYPRLPEPAPAQLVAVRAVPRRRLVSVGAAAVVLLFAMAAVRPEHVIAANADDLRPIGGHWRSLPGTLPARFLTGGSDGRRAARVFQAPTGERMELFIGTFAHLGTDGSLNYRGVALPRDVTVSEVVLGTDPSSVRVNRAAFGHSGRKTSVLYWYDLDGQVASRQTTAKAYNVKNLLMGAPQAAKLIVIVTDQPAGATYESSALTQFVQDVVRVQAAPTDEGPR